MPRELKYAYYVCTTAGDSRTTCRTHLIPRIPSKNHNGRLAVEPLDMNKVGTVHCVVVIKEVSIDCIPAAVIFIHSITDTR